MAKFYGKIGYVHRPKLTSPGVWEEEVVEQPYFGDVNRTSRALRDNGKVNDDLTVGNSISIVADAYANEHFHAIRYAEWAGALWTVNEVVVESPRLILQLGGLYDGAKATAQQPS